MQDLRVGILITRHRISRSRSQGHVRRDEGKKGRQEKRAKPTHQRRIHKPHRRLPRRNPLLINAIQHARKHRTTRAGPPNQRRRPRIEDNDIITNSANIGVPASILIINPPIRTERIIIRARIIRILRPRRGEIIRHGTGLVRRDGVDIREASPRREARDGDLLVFSDVAAGGQEGGARGGEVGARCWEIGGEDVSVGAEAAVCVVVARGARDAGVAGRDEDGHALHAEFHEFVALALLVGGWEVGFLAAVGDTNNVGGLVDSALKRSLVAAWLGIRVWWVERAVAGFSKGGVRAIGAVNGVEKVVEEAFEGIVGFVDVVVSLEEDAVLGVDDWIGDLEIQIGFGAGVCESGNRCSGAIDTVESGVSSLRNVGGKRQEKVIEICLAVHITQVFEDPKLVTGSSFCRRRNVIQSLNA